MPRIRPEQLVCIPLKDLPSSQESGSSVTAEEAVADGQLVDQRRNGSGAAFRSGV